MASAYHLQFQCSYSPFQIGKQSKAKTEAKVKNFGWTAIHQRIPTAETLVAHGMDPNQMCSLCNICDEDAWHLFTECPFTREVLCLIWQWCGLAGTPTQASPSFSTADWLSCCAAAAKSSLSLSVKLWVFFFTYGGMCGKSATEKSLISYRKINFKLRR
jgi:hypothetical protein